jgi:hypothetical protein
MRTILFFIFIFLYNGLSSEAHIDLCTFNSTNRELPSTWSYSTVDQVKRCFENIPINNSTMHETMKQLFNSLDFYSFLSLVRQSGHPYFTNIHLREDLLIILHQLNLNMYKNDYDFHIDIVTCFKNLKDFHTKYIAPNGYAKFDLLLPFIFQYFPTTKQIKVKTGINLYFSIIENNLNINYTDKIITMIDGINAFEYMNQFAEQYSLISKK